MTTSLSAIGPAYSARFTASKTAPIILIIREDQAEHPLSQEPLPDLRARARQRAGIKRRLVRLSDALT
jgi:hypothetical protein